MASYLGIVDFFSVNSSGSIRVPRTEIMTFDTDGDPISRFREVESEAMRGYLVGGSPSRRLYEVRQVLLDGRKS